MIERDVSKEDVEYSELYALLSEKSSSFSIGDQGDVWHVIIDDAAVVDDVVQQLKAFRVTHTLWGCVVVEVGSGERPLKVKRGEREESCYVTNLVRASLSKVTIGMKVLVGFVDGDRKKPVVVG